MSDTTTAPAEQIAPSPTPAMMPQFVEPKQPDPAPAPVTESPAPATPAAPTSETVELDRFKAVQKIARQNEDDAKRYRQIVQQVSGDSTTPTDPLAEIQKLRGEVESERLERHRESIARETGVPPELITGADQAAMRASAQTARDWVSQVTKAATDASPNPNGVGAFPASVVKSDGAIAPNGQITSRDELQRMTQAEIVQARKDGRLDQMMGKMPGGSYRYNGG
jgi:hypothetical protein